VELAAGGCNLRRDFIHRWLCLLKIVSVGLSLAVRNVSEPFNVARCVATTGSTCEDIRVSTAVPMSARAPGAVRAGQRGVTRKLYVAIPSVLRSGTIPLTLI
jgi:hypothetical protein